MLQLSGVCLIDGGVFESIRQIRPLSWVQWDPACDVQYLSVEDDPSILQLVVTRHLFLSFIAAGSVLKIGPVLQTSC